MDEEEEREEGEVGEYKLQRVVGKGSFAAVHRAAHRRTGARVAVKAIDRRRVDKRVHDGILQEREILRSIDHPNILRLLDTIDVRCRLAPLFQVPIAIELNSTLLSDLTRVCSVLPRAFLAADEEDDVPGTGVLRRRRPRCVSAQARSAAGGRSQGLDAAARYWA